MDRIQVFFDYIYYRIYRFFKERGDNISEYSAMLVLSIMQCFTLLDIVVFIRFVFPFPLPDKIYIVPIIAVIGVLNWFRYECNFDIERLHNQWQNEDEKRKVRNGWLIGLYLLISFLIPAVHGYLEHNVKVI